jgi:hypothetical protein
MSAALITHSALYKEMSDHPDSATDLNTLFTTNFLANPVIQTLITEQPIPITARGMTFPIAVRGTIIGRIPLFNYTRSVQNGYILPALAPFSIEQLTEAINLLEFWQFPDSTKAEADPANTCLTLDSPIYWIDVLTHERDIRTLAATAASIDRTTVLEIPKSLHKLRRALYQYVFRIFYTDHLFEEIIGLRGYSTPQTNAKFGRGGMSFYDAHFKTDDPRYAKRRFAITDFVSILNSANLYGELEIVELIRQTAEGRDCIDSALEVFIGLPMDAKPLAVIEWLQIVDEISSLPP